MGEEGYPEECELPDFVGKKTEWDAYSRKLIGGGIGLYPGPGRPARGYNYVGQAQSSMQFTLSNSVADNLIVAFNGNPDIEKEPKMYEDPDKMEAAALRMATLAQEIREFDEREPQGEEPVITWRHVFLPRVSTQDGKEYVYVAVKLGDRWYVTGSSAQGVSYTWRQFRDHEFAKELTMGDFHLVTEWTYQGNEG